ncbi:MAG: S41 family peptidase, partial [Alphaproteobacteria bacterium]|nr:S41 family peptidase [Alphaproteobacteria bacterium]
MAKIRGARIWWAPSTTATSLAVIGALAVLLPARAPAGGGVERLVRDVRAASGPHLPTLEEVTGRCASDTLCAAQVLAQAIGPRARIEDVRHPSTDQIRWVTSARSVASASVDEAILTIRLIRFGRKAVPEIRNELETRLTADSEIKTVVLDLRANQGGDLDRMLRVAATFTGPVQNAVRLIGWNGATALSIPRTDPVF